MRLSSLNPAVAIGLLLPAAGNGVLRYGFGAADSGAAGAFSGTAADAMSAMQTNPAALAALTGNEWTLGLRAIHGEADYNHGGRSYEMSRTGAVPEMAVAWRDGHSRWTFGLSFAALSALEGQWNYPDVPGGIGGVTYGTVPHESGFLALRTNLGAAISLSETLSLGASIGAIYSEVDFDAPFIFQSNPALAGAKVDLDMTTDGWAMMPEAGLLWRPDPCWSFGMRARPRVELDNDGDAFADYSAQLPPLGLAGTPPYARYDATTHNALPFIAGFGASWQASGRLKIGLWADWIQWSKAFDQLDVALSGGTNPAINGAIGSAVADRVPVGWKDRWVLALGAEYEISSSWTVRAGWRYGESPAPDALITPLNVPLPEHAVALGLGWRTGDWRFDLGYELQFGPAANAAASGYRAGEYSNSRTELTVQSLALGMTRRF
ncbi:OmpP1/FadL family transporter [Luteolibacter marinus]|uniref:OmpP1/FadL family transporter n=1 Tax=Luteolibacter marinus TaxID=2776705 RepID=UPI001866C14E|nr:outer membrane protein transport protein [Luteolibacter marinus]